MLKKFTIIFLKYRDKMNDKPSIAMIVAMSENRVIGKNNALPWHLPADLAFFKKTTLGHPVLMGRKTYQSIGRLLPGRRNLILTRDPSFRIDKADIFSSVDEAIASCGNSEKLFIIGGAELFNTTLNITNELYVTIIHAEVEGDTFFPVIDLDLWHTVSSEYYPQDDKNKYSMSFIHYQRR
ncbi:dihydrofolate reductase [Ferrovum sp. PN-J185]|nr:dihydrofolate reductase [Ferrovum sp. PN-J185]